MGEVLVGAVRVVHIGSAIALAGSTFLWTIVIAPTLSRSLPGPRAGEVFSLLGPRLGRYAEALAVLTFASGALLLGTLWGWSNVLDVLLSGELYGTLLLTGILAFFGGVGVAEGIIAPTGRRLASLPADATPALIGRLQRRQAKAFLALAALDLLALTMMALGVNARA